MAELYGGIRSPQNKQLGERFMCWMQAINKIGTPLPDIYVSATFTAYDSLNNVVIPTVPVVTTRTTANGSKQLYSPVDCRPNQQITVAGTYKFVFAVKMSDGDVQDFLQYCVISPTP